MLLILPRAFGTSFYLLNTLGTGLLQPLEEQGYLFLCKDCCCSAQFLTVYFFIHLGMLLCQFFVGVHLCNIMHRSKLLSLFRLRFTEIATDMHFSGLQSIVCFFQSVCSFV